MAIRFLRTICSIQFTKPPIQRLLRCSKCRSLGNGKNVYIIGMISKHNIKIAMILKEATIPNSLSNLLSVKINVAKPEAVVILVINVAFPTFVMTRCSDFTLLPCSLTSCWYLLIRKIQLGKPITIIKGGINAVSTVIS